MPDEARILERFTTCCPDCRAVLTGGLRCGNCGWTGAIHGDVPLLISREDTADPLFARYADNYDQISTDDLTQDILPRPYKLAQRDKLLKYCGAKLQGEVLDVGCGQGDFLRGVPHDRKLGVDISLVYLERVAAEGIPCVQANAENLPFQNSFDLIVVTDVLEHVFHPHRVLEGVRCSARDGARVILRVPYREDLSSYSPEAGCKYEFVHLRSFDEDSLRSLVEEAGLTFERFHYDGWAYSRRFSAQHGLRHRLTDAALQLYHSAVPRRLLQREASDAEIHYARCPNWLGRQLFEPYEITAVASISK